MLNLEQVKAVIFDMDGLMIDSEPIYQVSWYEAAKAQGVHLEADFYPLVQGRKTAEAEHILFGYSRGKIDIRQFQADWPKRWQKIGDSQGIPLKRGLQVLLQRLRAMGLPLAVATSSNASIMHYALQAAGLISYFDELTHGQETSKGKPEPDIYLLAAQKLNVHPQNCLVFEDSPSGTRAALRAGMQVVMVPDHVQPTPALRKEAHLICDSLDAFLQYLPQ
jgi:HAD superfamily hydrolase (TIGR01509 family)